MTWPYAQFMEIVDFVERHTSHAEVGESSITVDVDVVPQVIRFDCSYCRANLQIKVDLKDDDDSRT